MAEGPREEPPRLGCGSRPNSFEGASPGAETIRGAGEEPATAPVGWHWLAGYWTREQAGSGRRACPGWSRGTVSLPTRPVRPPDQSFASDSPATGRPQPSPALCIPPGAPAPSRAPRARANAAPGAGPWGWVLRGQLPWEPAAGQGPGLASREQSLVLSRSRAESCSLPGTFARSTQGLMGAAHPCSLCPGPGLPLGGRWGLATAAHSWWSEGPSLARGWQAWDLARPLLSGTRAVSEPDALLPPPRPPCTRRAQGPL